MDQAIDDGRTRGFIALRPSGITVRFVPRVPMRDGITRA
jgi:hypothetical protein